MEVAILGAGIAGVSTAIALKLHGINVSIYERHQTSSTIGGGMVLWPNATYVLQQLGVLKQVEPLAGQPQAMQRISASGEKLGTLDIQLINREMGFTSLSILRRDLQHILLEKLAVLGVEVNYGYQVKSLSSTIDNNAIVSFENGVRVSADVIIGADGRMMSKARHYVLGDNTPIYQKFINWVGVFESSEDVFEQININDYWGQGERFGIVPINARKAYWAGGVASEHIETHDPAHYQQELNRIFANWPAPIPLMIASSTPSSITKIYVHDHQPTQHWHRNNVILIGDAAHAPLPTSGQGACQALEDAWCLANALRQNSQLSCAFSSFVDQRFQKTTSIIMAARNFAASLFNSDASFCRIRDEQSKVSDFNSAAKEMAGLWRQNLPI